MMLSAISREMVQLYKSCFGRGPTRTRTNWTGSDMLVVTLEDSFTPLERRLLAIGEHQRLRDLRALFQHEQVELFCEPIERLTSRKVRAFLSATDVDADVSTEMFVLHPQGYDGPSRTTPSSAWPDRREADGA